MLTYAAFAHHATRVALITHIARSTFAKGVTILTSLAYALQPAANGNLHPQPPLQMGELGCSQPVAHLQGRLFC
ncbi:hypothetical protein D3C79_1082130 [compost metagenome]